MAGRNSKMETARFRRDLAAAAGRAMMAGGQVIASAVKVSINRSNAGRNNPSKPGEPPKKVTGNLQKSIAVEEPKITGKTATVRIGTNVPYAAVLEHGFRGTVQVKQHMRVYRKAASRVRSRKKTGRTPVGAHTRTMAIAARPYLEPGLRNNLDKAGRAIVASLRRDLGGK